MKYSMRVKLTVLLTTLIFVTIALVWVVNHTFLESYYLSTKLKGLDNSYQGILSTYKSVEDDLHLEEEVIEKLDKQASSKGIEIIVYSVDLGVEISYSSDKYLEEGNDKQKFHWLREYVYAGSSPWLQSKELLKETDHYQIYRVYDELMDAQYIDLIGFVESDKIVLMRTDLERIQEGVKIANQFLAYIGIGAIIISSCVMFLLSRRFVRPIQELANIAKWMSDLNFDVKYKVNTKDEIGELGNSINSLSDKLESTITELKQANNELLKDIQQKTEIEEMRNEFLSNVSHELKTPLSIIQGYTEGLKENILDDEESKNYYCDIIMDEAAKMNKMIKNLLSLNELEFGNNKVKFERFNIVYLINSVLNSTEILRKQKEVNLHFEDQEPVYVWADMILIEQVITNYISNALNHVSGAKIIEIKVIQREDVVRIAVFNTGDLIPEDDLDKIWIKFHKVDRARTREYGGNGIGLSIVKAIMSSHNRECGVVNRRLGVEFWFELDSTNV